MVQPAMWCVVLGAVCACGRVEFELAPLDDGGEPPVDAPLGAFAQPQPAPALSHPLTDDDPTATGDALELYFASERIGLPGGYADIYVSTRASRQDPWGPPQNVVELNSADEDQSPGVSSDGLAIYFASRRPSPLGGTHSNIWVATRASRSAAWGTPTFVAELSTTLEEFEPQPDETGLRIVLYRQLTTANRTPFEATRASPADPWGMPIAIASVDDPGFDDSPCIRLAGRELWFASDRGAAMGVRDIFKATRGSATDSFSAAEAVSELNAATDDSDAWISPDGHVVLFATDRDGNSEIYEAQR